MKLTFINPTYSKIVISYIFYYLFTIITYLVFNYVFLPTTIKNKIIQTVELFGAKKLFYSFIRTNNIKRIIKNINDETKKTMKYTIQQNDLDNSGKLKEKKKINNNLSGGGKYEKDDIKEFYTYGSGSGAYYKITNVDSNGKITEFEIVSGGKGYKEGDILEFRINKTVIDTLKKEINKILDEEIEESKDKYLLKANLEFFKKTMYFYLVCLVLVLFLNLIIFNSSKNEYKKELKKIFSGNTYIVMILSNIISGLGLFGLTYIVSNSIALPYILFKAFDFFLIYIKQRSEIFIYIINTYLSIKNEDILLISGILGIGTEITRDEVTGKLNNSENYRELIRFKEKLKTFNQENWDSFKEFLNKN